MLQVIVCRFLCTIQYGCEEYFYYHKVNRKWTWYRWNSTRQSYKELSMTDLMLTSNKRLLEDVNCIPPVFCDSEPPAADGEIEDKKAKACTCKVIKSS